MNNQSVNLVVYFSAEKNTTRGIAQILAQNVFANLLEIKPKEPYTDKDLDWRRFFSRCNKEHRRKILPEIEEPGVDLTQYSVIFLGFPIWYGKAPNIVKSFLRHHNWSGQKIVLFATSGGSGVEKAEEDLKKQLGSKIIGSRLFDAAAAADWDEIGAWGSSIIESLSSGPKKAAEDYVEKHYVAPKEPEDNDDQQAFLKERSEYPNSPRSGDIKYSTPLSGIRFSLDLSERDWEKEEEERRKRQELLNNKIKELDRYDRSGIRAAMQSMPARSNSRSVLKVLDNYTDQSFVGKLMQLIRDRGLSEPVVYKAALIDRKLFSKIISDQNYKPSKDTCVALACALKLNLAETNDLLSRAGYTFSHSNKRDVILEYFFASGKYDIYEINEVLFQLFQKPLGRMA